LTRQLLLAYGLATRLDPGNLDSIPNILVWQERGTASSIGTVLNFSLTSRILLGFVLSFVGSVDLRTSPAADVCHLKNIPSSCCFLFLSQGATVSQDSPEKQPLEGRRTETLD